MKNTLLSLFALALLPLASAFGGVIYGEDNRLEVYEGTPYEQKLARSAAVMVSKFKISKNGSVPGIAQIDQLTLRGMFENSGKSKAKLVSGLDFLFAEEVDEIKLCEGERFADQPSSGTCSGFLIAPDLIATAGHCAEIPTFCSEYRWVFDYQVDPITQTAGINMKDENIYSCKKVIRSSLDMNLSTDYAIVQLDRRVKGRTPLTYRNDGKIPDLSSLFVIGAPSGLPLKIAGGGSVRSNKHPMYFSSNLDVFQGNSGSAVFNTKTGAVEGILVRGEEDFTYNPVDRCVQTNKCSEEGCRGEDVSRFTSIPEIGFQKALYQAAERNNTKLLNEILKSKFWIDFYGRNGESALIKAARRGHIEAMGILLANGADANLSDIDGNRAVHYLSAILTEDKASMISELVKNGAQLHLRNSDGETALNFAAKRLNEVAVLTLIAEGAEMNSLDNKTESILFPFVRAERLEIVKKLIDLGVDASWKNNEGQSIYDLTDVMGKKIIQKPLSERIKWLPF